MEKAPYDELLGRRIHFWVLVLPNHREDVTVPFFIEPSTGESFLVDDEETEKLYFGVESLWNDKNYWCNMQGCPDDECECKTDWNLKQIDFWEHLLPGAVEEEPLMRVDDELLSNIVTDSDVIEEKALDMPHSYVEEIEISRSGTYCLFKL